MDKVIELFGKNTRNEKINWEKLVQKQICPFTNKQCYKVRKSDSNISIGTCIVGYGVENTPIVICPNRFLQNHKVFIDCLHLLHLHQPGNDIHVIPEFAVPGGSVDYIITSVKDGKAVDFVGIEFQTLDTTGTVWPYRQRFLKMKGLDISVPNEIKNYGMNWKMTAKTILVQMHHKIDTFENLNKHIVLIIQDKLLNYMRKEFDFSVVNNPALTGDSLQFHSYSIDEKNQFSLSLKERISTNSDGMTRCLGLKAEARVELSNLLQSIEKKISAKTLLRI